jgi:uncharacterized protein (TIRG00374 family)
LGGQVAVFGTARWLGLVRRTAVTGSSIARYLFAVAVAVAVVVIGLTHRATLDAGSRSLASAHIAWLALAALGAVAILIAGTVTQLGSMPVRPPFRRLLAVEAAASFANHLLPAGSGGIGVNIRFLRRHGLDSCAAASTTGLKAAAGAATHLLLLIATVAISPTLAARVSAQVSWHRLAAQATTVLPWATGAMGAVVLVGTVLLLRAGLRRRLVDRYAAGRSRVAYELRRLGSVVRNPYRATALWLGSASTRLLHAVVLFAVLRSLGAAVGVGTAVVVYLLVSAISGMVPSPGGLGALDAALLAALAAVGVSSAVALGAVLGYRLITVWLPFLPGALALMVLIRRRII